MSNTELDQLAKNNLSKYSAYIRAETELSQQAMGSVYKFYFDKLVKAKKDWSEAHQKWAGSLRVFLNGE